jgi:hypothetical protein
MPIPAVLRIAQEYADVLNHVGPDGLRVDAVFEDAAYEQCWDERSNLFSMTAEDPTDYLLVLAERPGSEDYVVVRWDDGWFVDTTPVEWPDLAP